MKNVGVKMIGTPKDYFKCKHLLTFFLTTFNLQYNSTYLIVKDALVFKVAKK